MDRSESKRPKDILCDSTTADSEVPQAAETASAVSPDPAKAPETKAGVRRKKRRFKSFNQYMVSFDGYYTLKGQLGAGAGSEVFNCQHKRSGKEYACKIVKLDPDRPMIRKSILKEIEILYICRPNPHIIDMEEYFEENNQFYLIYQKMEGGPLLEYLSQEKPFFETEVREIILEIGDALQFLHRRGIAHRDLKPANILCEQTIKVTPVRLCDFDLGSAVGAAANRVTTPELLTPVGSCEFMAPEVVAAFADDDLSYDKKCDVWSFGVIVYTILCGYPPFQGHCGAFDCMWDDGGDCFACRSELLSKIGSGSYDFNTTAWKTVSDAAKDLVTRLLVKDVRRRYTVDQMLAHPFVTNEVLSARPLATPSMLQRSGSRGSIDLFSATVAASLRSFESVEKRVESAPQPVFICPTILPDRLPDLESLQLGPTGNSAIAKRRLSRVSSPCSESE
ncbi:MAP kinase-interacting serine/threonine-protein kinase 1-like [Sycon ciliatum]|uniref:MAP kinase-interacting serine/threonine-protein kinase 1-like n=1 Tax=Sycon ciliatum TaxID=27933 RepID=UPI0031F71114